MESLDPARVMQWLTVVFNNQAAVAKADTEKDGAIKYAELWVARPVPLAIAFHYSCLKLGSFRAYGFLYSFAVSVASFQDRKFRRSFY